MRHWRKSENAARYGAIFLNGQISIDQADRRGSVGGMGHGQTCAHVVEGRAVHGELPKHILPGILGHNDRKIALVLWGWDSLTNKIVCVLEICWGTLRL